MIKKSFQLKQSSNFNQPQTSTLASSSYPTIYDQPVSEIFLDRGAASLGKQQRLSRGTQNPANGITQHGQQAYTATLTHQNGGITYNQDLSSGAVPSPRPASHSARLSSQPSTVVSPAPSAYLSLYEQATFNQPVEVKALAQPKSASHPPSDFPFLSATEVLRRLQSGGNSNGAGVVPATAASDSITHTETRARSISSPAQIASMPPPRAVQPPTSHPRNAKAIQPPTPTPSVPRAAAVPRAAPERSTERQDGASSPSTAATAPPGTWEHLISLTKACPRYQKDYSFQLDDSWVSSRAHGPW